MNSALPENLKCDELRSLILNAHWNKHILIANRDATVVADSGAPVKSRD